MGGGKEKWKGNKTNKRKTTKEELRTNQTARMCKT